jgi:peptidyl-prolyl cis-trans isomerase-like protein 2
VTKESLSPSDLITLNYSRNANGELNDPVTFKVFSEHSHIVAVATTGNVFLADTVKQFAASGKDLVSDTDFKKSVRWYNSGLRSMSNAINREDLITLQDPHGFGVIQKPAEPVASSKKASVVCVIRFCVLMLRLTLLPSLLRR